MVQSFTSGDAPVRYRFWTLSLAVASYFRRYPELLRLHARELPRLLAQPRAVPADAPA